MGGHATLVPSAAVRNAVPVFQPAPERVAALSEAIRKFDPDRILNPGRLVG